MVEQVVSTTTGIVVFSQTAQLNTYNDAAGQGADLAAFDLGHANRGLAAIGDPPAAVRQPDAAHPAPAPRRTWQALRPAQGRVHAGARAEARVRRRARPRGRQLRQPRAAEYAVLPIEGTADAALRDAAARRLALRTNGERAATTAAACAGHALRAVLGGT